MAKRPVKKTAQQTAQKRPGSRLAVLLLAVLLVVLSVQIFRMFDQLRSARAEEEAYAQQLAQLQADNQQLQDDLANSGSLNLIEDIARNELGMVSEGEKVFHFNQ